MHVGKARGLYGAGDNTLGKHGYGVDVNLTGIMPERKVVGL